MDDILRSNFNELYRIKANELIAEEGVTAAETLIAELQDAVAMTKDTAIVEAIGLETKNFIECVVNDDTVYLYQYSERLEGQYMHTISFPKSGVPLLVSLTEENKEVILGEMYDGIVKIVAKLQYGSVSILELHNDEEYVEQVELRSEEVAKLHNLVSAATVDEK